MNKSKRFWALIMALCLLVTMCPGNFEVMAVTNGDVTAIEIVSLPRKTEYFIGETLDTEGLTLFVTYADDTVEEISQGFTVSGFNSGLAGTQTLTVSYGGKTDTFLVKVSRVEVTGIEIAELPIKTQYWTGETLDTTGLSVVVFYSDDSFREITEGFTVSGFNNTVAGTQTLTVSYMGKTDTYTVTVTASSVTEIDIVMLPEKTEYWVGEELDTTGLILVVFYSDDTAEEIIDGFTVSGFNSAVAGDQLVTVSYQGATVEFAVTVSTPELIGIEIVSLPDKREYWTGDFLDTTGLTLRAHYSNGTTVQVTSGFTVTGFDNTLAGQQRLTVYYEDASASFSVSVKELYLTDIVISTPPVKTVYWIGESFDPTGLTLTVSYSDGRVVEITEGYTISGFGSSSAGVKNVSVEYAGAFAILNVEVKAPTSSTISKLEICTLPNKTEYLVGEKKDLTGLSVYVIYSDGSKEVITGGWADSGFSSTTAGTKTIRLIYKLKRISFTVTVKAVTGIEITAQPIKTEYWVGESLDITGLVVSQTYSNDTKTAIAEGYTLSGFDSDTAGEKTVTVTYEGYTATFKVNVKTPYVTGIAIATQPGKTEYWAGEELDITGLTLTATYSDGSKTTVADGFAISGFESTAGEKTITVTYEGYTATFKVNVNTPYITGIAIATQPGKTEYWAGEELDITGLTLTATYSDGSKTTVADGFVISGFDSAVVGRQTITVSYDGFTAEFSVVVSCKHTEAENGVCSLCKETIVAVVTDENGALLSNHITAADAFATAKPGNAIRLLTDAQGEDLVLPANVGLDLNGCTLTVNSLLTYGSSAVVDTGEEKQGLLKFLADDGNMISRANLQLPVYDSEMGGYRFFAVTVTPKTVTGGNKYWFRVDVEKFDQFHQLLRSGAEVRIQVKMTWDGQTADTYALSDVAFTQTWADHYAENSDTYITVSVTEREGVENFLLIPGIVSGGVEIYGEEM